MAYILDTILIELKITRAMERTRHAVPGNAFSLAEQEREQADQQHTAALPTALAAMATVEVLLAGAKMIIG